tara:strand:- start:215 stop:412 length:198 start_codon:yes stop_codon:yes gene_type:complete
MNKEKFLRCAVAHLENELSATKAELAELREVINKLPSRNSANLVNEIYNAIELAKVFTQAKEQSE